MNSAPGLLSVMGESGRNPDGPEEDKAVAGRGCPSPNQYLPMKRNFHCFGFQAIEDTTKGGLPHPSLTIQTQSHYHKYPFTFSIQYSLIIQTPQTPLLGRQPRSHCKPSPP